MMIERLEKVIRETEEEMMKGKDRIKGWWNKKYKKKEKSNKIRELVFDMINASRQVLGMYGGIAELQWWKWSPIWSLVTTLAMFNLKFNFILLEGKQKL